MKDIRVNKLNMACKLLDTKELTATLEIFKSKAKKIKSVNLKILNKYHEKTYYKKPANGLNRF